MSKIDYKKELKHLYRPTAREFVLVDVPPMDYLMIDGQGDPNTAQEYQEAIEALYSMAYTLKFMSKRQKGLDYVVPPLEGLWWAEGVKDFARAEKSAWDWTAMIMQPQSVTEEMFREAVAQVAKKKDLPALPKMRLETYHEGPSAQIMYIGPWDAEGPTIARMHAFIGEKGYRPSGKHHEIYLSDPRRVPPEKLKTVLRQPVREVLGGES